VRVFITTSLATGCKVNHATAQLRGKGTSERSLFRNNHGFFTARDIVVGDSNFESFIDSSLLPARGIDAVCCINGTRNSPFEGVCETIEEKLAAKAPGRLNAEISRNFPGSKPPGRAVLNESRQSPRYRPISLKHRAGN